MHSLPFHTLVLLAGTLTLGVLHAQQPDPTATYLPLQVGTRWEYRSSANPKARLVVRVARHELVGDVKCAVLETTIDGNDKAPHTEHLAVQKDGILRYKVQDQTLTPPLLLFKLPPQEGQKWTIDCTTTDSARIKGTLVQTRASVSVPAEKYAAVVVHSDDFKIGTAKTPFRFWLVPGVGIVKQLVQIGGAELSLELEKFVPAK